MSFFQSRLSKKHVLWWLTILIGLATFFSWRFTNAITAAPLPPIVFVARTHLATPDTIFKEEDGPAGQFGTGIDKYAPGSKLVLRNADGSLTVYNTPGLIDVQSPDVSFDGSKIVFSGAKTLDPDSANYGWRLYEINVDGSNFHQLTFSDRSITIPNAALYGNQETYGDYHDLYPAYLADGRIVFNSSRYPIRAHYDQRETFNLYVMDGDGTNLHRISTERASNLHPTPLPDGRILVSRWWNQFNQPSSEGIFNRIDNSDSIQVLEDGTILFANPDKKFDPTRGYFPEGVEIRKAPNTWHLMVLNPDGSDFQRLAWTPRYKYTLTNDSGASDTFAAAQPAVVIQNNNINNYVIAYTFQNDQTMVHSTRRTGIRVAYSGLDMLYANATEAIAGYTYELGKNDVETSEFALNPAGLADGRILYAQSHQDLSLPRTGIYSASGKSYELLGSEEKYRLYVMNVDGSAKTLVPTDLSSIGMPTANAMDAVPVEVRYGWSALMDTFTAVASDDPTNSNVPNSLLEYAFNQNNNIELVTISNPNVYANASLDFPYVNNSPPPGSVAVAEIWIDPNQFTGAYCYPSMDCTYYKRDNELRAMLYTMVPVIDGAFTAQVPADLMSFVVLRDANGRIVREWNRGYASIAQGSAWARPGETITCVGCHMGHVSGSLDGIMAQSIAGNTNIAPYATASASSQFRPDIDTFNPEKINDRRGWIPVPANSPNAPFLEGNNEVGYQDAEKGWISEKGSALGEWVQLDWPADQRITAIRLVGPVPSGGDWDGFGVPAERGNYYVEKATLRLYRNGTVVETIQVNRIEPFENGGTEIVLASPVVVDRIRLTVNETQGAFFYGAVAAINEIEVIGKASEIWPLLDISSTYLPSIFNE
ncbi:MAG: hypothetical protein AAF490_24310 [Chloroflexota bacterium]